MRQETIIWVLVSTTSQKEAEKIGRAVLKKRLAACFGIYPRLKSFYFWPASRRLEHSHNNASRGGPPSRRLGSGHSDASRGGPPKSNQLEESKGPLLILETLPKNAKMLSSAVKQLHSDKVPFIGSVTIESLNSQFLKWMQGEIRK